MFMVCNRCTYTYITIQHNTFTSTVYTKLSLGACEGPLMGPGLAGCLLRLLPPADKELHPGDGDDHVDDNSELDIAAVRSGDVRYQHLPATRHPGQPTQRQQL